MFKDGKSKGGEGLYQQKEARKVMESRHVQTEKDPIFGHLEKANKEIANLKVKMG